MKFNLSISGPTGAGKTTLSNFICSRPNIDLVSEDVPEYLFRKFTNDPQEYCFELQKNIMISRSKNYMSSTNEIKVIDRTANEDLKVFIAMHRKLGFLSDEQTEELTHVSHDVDQVLGKIDATVFVNADIFCLKHRMQERGVPVFLIENISLQMQLYENWKKSIKNQYLEIDNTSMSIFQLKCLADMIYERIADSNNYATTAYNIFDGLC